VRVCARVQNGKSPEFLLNTSINIISHTHTQEQEAAKIARAKARAESLTLQSTAGSAVFATHQQVLDGAC
jgi:hypothetical protein